MTASKKVDRLVAHDLLHSEPRAGDAAESRQRLESRPRYVGPHLWEAADILRGSIDAADYKNYIFGLLFQKRINDPFSSSTTTYSTSWPG